MIRAYELYLRRPCCHPRCRGLSTRQPSVPLAPTRPQWRPPVHFDVANQLPMPLCTCVESKWLPLCSVLCKHLNSLAIGIRDDNGSEGGGLLIPALYRYLTSSEWLYRWDIWTVSAAAAWWPEALGPVNLTAIGAAGGGGPSWRRLLYFLVLSN